MKLIVGLGNPGKKYAATRHNVGFLVVNKLALALGLPEFKMDKKFKAEISPGASKNKIVIAKPQTFMNESGGAVRALADFYKIKPSEIIVIHDDKDIPIGEYKVQTNRGPAGHNGVISLISHLGTQNFTRARVGIKPAKEIKDTADFVLAKFTKEEQKALEEVIDKVITDIKKIL
ncbi:MAG: aminoacyl-tRNA hydrolase [Patescibacteria group bacterium]